MNSDHGIDGEIEFKDDRGRASGKRLYVQLKSGDSYLKKRRSDGQRSRSRTRAGPITGSSRLTPSCWSSARRMAKSAGWT